MTVRKYASIIIKTCNLEKKSIPESSFLIILMLPKVIFGKLKRFLHFLWPSVVKGLETENKGLKNIVLAIKVHMKTYNPNACAHVHRYRTWVWTNNRSN